MSRAILGGHRNNNEWHTEQGDVLEKATNSRTPIKYTQPKASNSSDSHKLEVRQAYPDPWKTLWYACTYERAYQKKEAASRKKSSLFEIHLPHAAVRRFALPYFTLNIS